MILNAPFYIPRIVLHKDLRIVSIRSRIRTLSTSFYAQIPSQQNNTFRQQADFNRSRKKQTSSPVNSSTKQIRLITYCATSSAPANGLLPPPLPLCRVMLSATCLQVGHV
ncbi:hypothetical protein TNCT_433631 [Trichonephila clavata]|uniref:Uncharacterized protein n=1 Tax=Trichonephila clavata TaxID=2740835 RepID=A0A8X6F933_TRICU|nr:hypothetical protein TNCT_433631 [Trichonephila clavata]